MRRDLRLLLDGQRTKFMVSTQDYVEHYREEEEDEAPQLYGG